MSTRGITVPNRLGLLPDTESRPMSFLTSALINLAILALFLYIGMTTKHVLEQRYYEPTVLIAPTTVPPPLKLKLHAPPKIDPPMIEKPKLEPPRIAIPTADRQHYEFNYVAVLILDSDATAKSAHAGCLGLYIEHSGADGT